MIKFQKFIFNDLDEIIEKITNYKKNKDKNLDFGDWKKVIDNIRSFDDLNGNKRISNI